MKTIKIQNIDVKYIMEETGKPKFLFIHGYRSSSDFIKELLKVERSYDIVALDLPSFGKTEYEGDVSIEFFAKIVEEFIEKLNLKDIPVLGHSMGGAVATYLSKKNINKIILLNPLNPFILKDVFKQISLKDIFGKLSEKPSAASNVIDMLRDYRNQYKFLVNKQMINDAWLGNDLYKKYKDSAPMMSGISCDDDLVISPESIKNVETSFGVEFIKIKEGGHSPINLLPKSFNDLLETMIK